LNNYLLSVLGNIGGDKYILAGCTAATGYAGYAFLGTNKFPAGELLYVEQASATTGYLCVRETNETVVADGYTYTNAYTKRSLVYGVPGAGVESYLLADFKQIKTNKELTQQLAELDETVRNFSPEAVGSMKFWPSLTIPANWRVCNGDSLDKTEYAALFAIVGTTFGGEGNFFKLPNVAGAFPVAYRDSDTDFGQLGKTGGEKAHQLTADELASHTHVQRVSIENSVFPKLKGYRVETDTNNYPSGSGDNVEIKDWVLEGASSDNCVHTKEAGGGGAHNNIPPYFALPFIIKVK
jgi:microcystin-dependent protein